MNNEGKREVGLLKQEYFFFLSSFLSFSRDITLSPANKELLLLPESVTEMIFFFSFVTLH